MTTTSSRRARHLSAPNGVAPGDDFRQARTRAVPVEVTPAGSSTQPVAPPAGPDSRQSGSPPTPTNPATAGSSRRRAEAHPAPEQLTPGGPQRRQANRTSATVQPAPIESNGRRAAVGPSPMGCAPGGTDSQQTTEPTSPSPVSSAGPNSRRAIARASTKVPPPAGHDSHPTEDVASPQRGSSGGPLPAGRRSYSDAHYTAAASDQPTDHQERPDTHPAGVVGDAAAGRRFLDDQPAGRHTPFDTQTSDAAGRQALPDTHAASVAGRQPGRDTQKTPAAGHLPIDAQGADAGRAASPDPAAVFPSTTRSSTLLDPALALAADILDDLERVRIANENRLRQLTRSTEDKDGEVRGFGLDESHPDVARLAAMVDTLRQLEHQATLNLERHMRRHPLGPWIKGQRGVGDKQAARLLALIGDPYIRPEIVRADNTVLPEGPRTVSALWAYAGLHVVVAGGATSAGVESRTTADQVKSDHRNGAVGGGGGDSGLSSPDDHTRSAGVAARRVRGQQANWSTRAKTRAYLIAESCMKQLSPQCRDGHLCVDNHERNAVAACACSPYRVVYDARRAHTAITRPDWTDGHSHADGLRVAAKAFLRDLWRAARDHHLNGSGSAPSAPTRSP